MSDSQLDLSTRDLKTLFAGFSQYTSVLLAVSGGSDSIALLHLASLWQRRVANAPRLSVATVNHGLREAAIEEAASVEKQCALHDLPFVQLDWLGDKPKSAVQAQAREARYSLLAGHAKAHGIEAIATAHTLDDQAETVLMRLCRGSGISGLRAMAAQSIHNGVPLLRPFLHLSKNQLRDQLLQSGVAWCEDPSNRNIAFLRPRLRTLLPQLAREGLDAARLSLLARKARRADEALDWATAHLLRNRDENGLPSKIYALAPLEIRMRLLKSMIGEYAGASYPPADDSLERLDQAILRDDHLRTTLHGTIATLKNGYLRFETELDSRKALKMKA